MSSANSAGSGQNRGRPSGRDRSADKLRVWRIPALEISHVLSIECGAADLENRVGSSSTPSHVTGSLHSLTDDGVDCGLGPCAGDRLPLSASLGIVREKVPSAPQVADKSAQRIAGACPARLHSEYLKPFEAPFPFRTHAQGVAARLFGLHLPFFCDRVPTGDKAQSARVP